MRYAWFLQDFTGKDQVDTEFPSLKEACAAAQRLRGVNPRSVSRPANDMFLFGPGDGTTSAMVRYLPVAEEDQAKK